MIERSWERGDGVAKVSAMVCDGSFLRCRSRSVKVGLNISPYTLQHSFYFVFHKTEKKLKVFECFLIL